MKKIIPLVLVFLTGCASLSKETVQLSEQVNVMVQESRDTHTALLDAYAQSRRERIDEYMESTWIPRFIKNMAEKGELYDKICKQKNSWDSAMELQGFVVAAGKQMSKKRKELTDALDLSISELRYELDKHYNILQLSGVALHDNLKSLNIDKEVNRAIAEKVGIKPPERLKEISDKLDKLFE